MGAILLYPSCRFNRKANITLLEELNNYGMKNLAMVRIMIQNPYVTKMKRDVAMTYTTYIANSGGLLGLCLGFSFISGVELIFWLCCCCKELWKYVQGNQRAREKKSGKKRQRISSRL